MRKKCGKNETRVNGDYFVEKVHTFFFFFSRTSKSIIFLGFYAPRDIRKRPASVLHVV